MVHFLLDETPNRSHMTLLLTNRDVRESTSITSQMDIIEKGLVEEAAKSADVPPRINLKTSNGFSGLCPAY